MGNELFDYITDEQLNYFSASHFRQGRYLEAAAAYDILLTRTTSKLSHIQLSETLNFAGLAYRHAGLLEKAELAYLKSLELNPSISVSNNIAIVYMEMAEYDRSEEMFKYVLTKTGQNMFYIANYATMLSFKGEYEKAMKMFLKALDAYEQNGENSNDYAHIKFRFGVLLSRMGFHTDSSKLLSDALVNKRRYYLEDHPCIGEIYKATAEDLYEEKKYDLSSIAAKKALSIYEGKLCSNAPEMGRLEVLLGALLITEGKYDQAIERFSKACNILRKAYKDHWEHPDIAHCKCLIGIALAKNKRYEPAFGYFNESTNLFHKAKVSSSVHLAKCYSEIGFFLQEKGKYREAFSFLKKARRVFLKIRFDHPDLANLYEAMQICLDNTNHPGFSLILRNKIDSLSPNSGVEGLVSSPEVQTYPHIAPIENTIRIILYCTNDMLPFCDMYSEKISQMVNYYDGSECCGVQLVNCCRKNVAEVLELFESKVFRSIYICFQGAESKTIDFDNSTALKHPWIMDYRGMLDIDVVNVGNFHCSDICYVYTSNVEDAVKRYNREISRCARPVIFKKVNTDQELVSNELIQNVSKRVSFYLSEYNNTIVERVNHEC